VTEQVSRWAYLPPPASALHKEACKPDICVSLSADGVLHPCFAWDGRNSFSLCTCTLGIGRIKNMEPKCDTDDVADPAAFIRFDSHTDAMQFVCRTGYNDALLYPPFSANDLVEATNTLIKDDNIVLMDMTTAVPTTAHAAYKALTIAGFNASASCKKDHNAAFLIMRTAANTPSFLIGHHWSITQTIGKERADEHVNGAPTPMAFLIFRDKQVYLPTEVCRTNVDVASRIVAQELTMKESLFCCCICHKGLVESHSGACVKVSRMAMSKCGHMFHAECIAMHIDKTASRACPGCLL